MTDAGQIVAAFRDIAATKTLSAAEVNDLLSDGILAGLVKIYGQNVEAEININEESGDIDIIVLKRVVEEVEDDSSEISLEEAHWDDDTYEVIGGGHRTMVRVVPHHSGDHPELRAADVRRFAADFAGSGSDRALLITEKYCPFEVYDRERRDPRARYITRERVQRVIDALALG